MKHLLCLLGMHKWELKRIVIRDRQGWRLYVCRRCQQAHYKRGGYIG